MSRTIEKILIAIALAVVTIPLRAQTDAQFTQYFEVPAYYNPAAIGNTDYVRIRVGSRLQWVGIDNAPTTIVGLADAPFKIGSKRIGAGVMFQQESAGLYDNITVGIQLGYKFKLGKGMMTVGVQPGVLNEKFKGSKVFIPDDNDYHNPTDEAIPTTDVGGTAFDLGVGAMWVHPRVWAGLSLTHALSPTINFSAEQGSGEGSGTVSEEKKFQFQARRTLYFMAGSNIPIKNTLFEVMPSVMVKSDFDYFGAEVTGRVRYNKFLTAGIGYRYNDAISAMASVEFKGFFLGYSFDYALTAINKASSGSHEIFAGYSLKLDFNEKNKNRHKSIRIM